MTFWILIAAMAALIGVLLVQAMRRPAAAVADAGPESAAAASDVQVYKDQLAEVERDVARGVIGAEEAERARTEISRRILAADGSAKAQKPARQGPGIAVALVLVAVLIAGALALYARLGAPGYGDMALADRIEMADEMRAARPSQAEAEAAAPTAPEPEGVTQDFKTLMDRLRAAVAERPDDLQGHRLLARNEARLGNFRAAAEAQDNVLRLTKETATAEDFTDLGEYLVMAAGGYVSPEAEVALRAALNRDAQDGRARYYWGLMMAQTGRPDVGFRMWDALLRQGPPDAPWIAPIRGQIGGLADLAGVRYELPPAGTGAAPGPTAEDIEAAGEMTAAERMEMIGGMVQGLSQRLATEGGPARDWARLITALGVLDRRAEARDIYDNALEVFAADPASLDVVRRAGEQAGIAG